MGSMLFHSKGLQADSRLEHKNASGLAQNAAWTDAGGGGVRVRGGSGRRKDRAPGRGNWGATAGLPDHPPLPPL